jgi:hypothetical protein
MAEYRLYFFDREGHIQHRVEFECETDAEALALVRQHGDGRPLELWRGTQLVREIAATARAG